MLGEAGKEKKIEEARGGGKRGRVERAFLVTNHRRIEELRNDFWTERRDNSASPILLTLDVTIKITVGLWVGHIIMWRSSPPFRTTWFLKIFFELALFDNIVCSRYGANRFTHAVTYHPCKYLWRRWYYPSFFKEAETQGTLITLLDWRRNLG